MASFLVMFCDKFSAFR